GVNISIEIGAGKDDDQRSIRLRFMELSNRVGAAPSVQCNEDVARHAAISLNNLYPVTEASENFSPSQGGNLVAVVESSRRRSDQWYFHAADYFAQVRKPAQTSRRSGV